MMAVRELRVVASERPVGTVNDDGPVFEGQADRVFARLRTLIGDQEAARQLIRDGWSNGYLYLTEASP